MSEEMATSVQQFLTFRLGAETFAVDVLQVREILDKSRITRVPQMPDYMMGVINLRGSVIPIIDLRLKFGMEASKRSDNNCIIVIEVVTGDDLIVAGIVTDAVSEVLDLKNDQIEESPRLGKGFNSEFIRGMGKNGDDFLIILNVDKIFNNEDVGIIAEAV